MDHLLLFIVMAHVDREIFSVSVAFVEKAFSKPLKVPAISSCAVIVDLDIVGDGRDNARAA